MGTAKNSRLMGRGLYKQPGGKLVGVSVRLSDDIPAYFRECASSIQSVEQCRIDGDFFLDGDDKGFPPTIAGLGKLAAKPARRAHTRHYATIASDYRELSERAIGGYDGRRHCHRFSSAQSQAVNRAMRKMQRATEISRGPRNNIPGEQPGMHNALTQEEYLERWRDPETDRHPRQTARHRTNKWKPTSHGRA